MDDFKDFIEKNRERIEKIARENTKYNEKGQATISRDDSWFNENVWDNWPVEEEKEG